MCLNSFEKVTLMDLSLWDELTNIKKKTDPKPLLVRPNPDPNKP
jgi:hypothetical protein